MRESKREAKGKGLAQATVFTALERGEGAEKVKVSFGGLGAGGGGKKDKKTGGLRPGALAKGVNPFAAAAAANASKKRGLDGATGGAGGGEGGLPGSMGPPALAVANTFNAGARKKSAAESLREEEERKKKRRLETTAAPGGEGGGSSGSSSSSGGGGGGGGDDDPWILPGIVVKVMAKRLSDGRYYKRKGLVRAMVSAFKGEVEMIDSGDVLKVR